KSFYALFIAMCFVACGAGNEKKESEPATAYDTGGGYTEETANNEIAPPAKPEEDAAKQINPSLPDVVVPKLIRTADLRFQVNDLEKSSDAIERLAKENGAYISTANLSSTNAESNNTVTIRVPNAQFDALLKSICRESVFMERKNVSTQDVTEEYIDIEARLKTKKEVEARYIEILKTKAKTVEDVLKAEEQIRVIREEIEAREGRLNYLKNQVSYSTIVVQVYQQIEYRENPAEVTDSFGNKAKSGFGQGWDVVKNIIVGIITLWPLWILVAGLYMVIRKQLTKGKKTLPKDNHPQGSNA
ncbi:MAG TPA: DUF4349 domain-containing protein, partial [Flavobacteriales bacterium]|nr:DUF4349 domain-containing protein [Flavobacteriales bacterium]